MICAHSPHLIYLKPYNCTCSFKDAGKAKTFQQAAIRNVGFLVNFFGDEPIADFSTIDAGKVRDAIIVKGLAVLSFKRTFISIEAIIYLAIAENGLDIRNPFSSIFMPDTGIRKKSVHSC